MKYVTFDSQNDKVLDVFRVNDHGIPEAWNSDTKAWEYKPYLGEYTTYQNLMRSEINPAGVFDRTGQKSNMNYDVR
jgi:hypothetical protein